MTYFRMQPPSHGTGPLAPGHLAMPLPRATSLSATPAPRRLAVKVQPPRACPGTGQIPAAGRLATRRHASPLAGTDLAQAARSNILPDIVLEIRSTDFADCPVRLQAEAAGDDLLLDLGGAAEDGQNSAQDPSHRCSWSAPPTRPSATNSSKPTPTAGCTCSTPLAGTIP
jgi:hypothetical protein